MAENKCCRPCHPQLHRPRACSGPRPTDTTPGEACSSDSRAVGSAKYVATSTVTRTPSDRQARADASGRVTANMRVKLSAVSQLWHRTPKIATAAPRATSPVRSPAHTACDSGKPPDMGSFAPRYCWRLSGAEFSAVARIGRYQW